MKLKSFYREFLSRLETIYSAHESANITNMCFEKFAGKSKADVIKEPEQTLPENEINRLKTSLSELLLHKPVQYILGEAWFHQLKFKVNEQVLIPRPETEELVREAIGFIKTSSGKKIIDIGTGSGCIAVSIKKMIPDSEISAIDIDEKTIAVARENAVYHQTAINFIKADILDTSNLTELGNYDLIISNPPYIPESEKMSMDKNVIAYEPHKALFVPDENPLIFYEAIARFGKNHLNEKGRIMMEVHENLAGHVEALFAAKQYLTETKKDIYGKERIVMAIHCR